MKLHGNGEKEYTFKTKFDSHLNLKVLFRYTGEWQYEKEVEARTEGRE